jgi:hypothetical protein
MNKKMYILSRDGHYIGGRCFKDPNQAKAELLLYRTDATDIKINTNEYGIITMSFCDRMGSEEWDIIELDVV